MKKLMFFALAFTPIILYAVVDVDTIFLWDNDRGVCSQQYPAIGIFLSGGYDWSAILDQDNRYGDYDIFLRYVRFDSLFSGAYRTISVDSFNRFQQTKPDIECNPYNRYIAVWEESLYIKGKEQPTAIYARRYGSSYWPFLVYQNSTYTSKNPSVACRKDGSFVVSFTRDFRRTVKFAAISLALYDPVCELKDARNVRDVDSILQRAPVSRVAFCDSGFVVVYEDSSKNGTRRSIYLSYYDRGGGPPLKEHLKVSNQTSDAANEEYPAVSVDSTGFGVIVWEDYRASQSTTDIYYRLFQMKGGSIELYDEKPVEQEFNAGSPRVAMLNNRSFFVVYVEKRTDNNNNILGRAYLNGSLQPVMTICNDPYNQLNPDIDARKGSDTFGIVWQSFKKVAMKQIPDTCYGVRSRFYWNNKEVIYPLDNPIDFVSDTLGGRRGWYFDDENYDDPSTAWNEDPIDEPDSAYIDLDLAIVDQLMELNTNNQYNIKTADTLPYRKPQKDLTPYEAIFVDLGYRTEDASAGTMTQEERDALFNYIYYDSLPTMIEGNDFGYYYDTTQLFKLYGADYLGDGAHYLDGNVDTLYGRDGSFKDLTLPYDHHSLVDNYVDSIQPTDALHEMIFTSSGAPAKWIAGRCVGWGTYWKDGTNKADKVDNYTVYSTCMLSSIKSGSHPNTYAEVYRRLLGYLGLTCQPEPITSIICSTYTAVEGSIMLKWQVVSDNTPTESAEGPYKLKFSATKMVSESAFNSAQEYYQTWTTKDSAVGDWRRQYVYGLPPAETLVLALKVSDEDTLWCALGAEPRVGVSGDTLTPHTLRIGSTYGYFKDFSNKYEYINRRMKYGGSDYDSLFVTWDGSYFFTGYARCDLRSEGDLFIYVDTKAGGADSTVDYNGLGSSSKSYFISGFRPDYCLVIENELSTGRIYYKWVPAKDGRAGSWTTVGSTAYHVEDGTINNYLYTEIRIPFDTIAYTPGSEFKLVVTMQNEATNEIINAYPIFNPLGTKVYLTQYYSWGAGGLQNGMVPARRGVIGIDEMAGLNGSAEIMHLSAVPNPFSGKTRIMMPAASNDGATEASLKIYDVTGRLVKNFNLHNSYFITHNSLIWDGTDDNGRALPGGIYFCEHAVAEKKEAIKIIYIR